MRQESHRIFLQNFAPRSVQGAASAPFGAPTTFPTRGGRAVVTTSAAVRLTDGARTCDVTKLLRGKFGLPSAPPGGGGDNDNNDRLDKIRSRLSEFRGSSSSPAASSTSLDKETGSSESLPPLEAGEYDTLVLVATLTSLPRGFVSYEHEDGSTDVSSLVDSESNSLVVNKDGGDGSRNRFEPEEGNISSQVDEGPPSPVVRLDLDRSRSVSSAVTVKASNAVSRQASSVSSIASSDVSSTAKEGVQSNVDPNRDPLEISASSEQGFPIVEVDPYRVRPAPGLAPSSLKEYEVTQAELSRPAAGGGGGGEDLDASLRDGVRTTGSTNGGWAAILTKHTPTGVIVNEDGTSRMTRPAEPASPPQIRPIHISGPPKRVEYDVSPEPYNIIRTLRPNESPLAVRDEVVRTLIGRLRQAERELGLDPRSDQLIPTPHVRWFFQPSHRVGGTICGRAMNVPGCIDLEGYCSGVDDCDEDDDDDKDNDEPDPGNVAVDRWWTKGPAELRDAKPYQRHVGTRSSALSSAQARLSDERHRLATLSRYVAALSEGNCIAGYLLKRSKRDPNIWQRVHCVLTEDSLFWVSRMRAAGAIGADMSSHQMLSSAMHPMAQSRSGSPTVRSVHFGPSSFGRQHPRASRIGRHHVIKLTSTLLIESDPTQSSNPLSNVPNSFEIICPTGPSHIFRVPPPLIAGFSTSDPRATCKRWVSAIGDRIVRCFEGNSMELAELIGSEVSGERWGRIASLTVTPFLGSMTNGAQSVKHHGSCLLSQNGWEGADSTSASAAIAEILRMGLDVAEYRDTIQHAQAALMLPGPEDDAIIGRIRQEDITSAWDGAERVLVKSSFVISMIEAKGGDAAELENILSEDDDNDNTDSVESLKGDVLAAHRRIALYLEEQKVLRERSARGENGEGAMPIPPADAFDDLLEKLQRLAASTEDRRRKRDEKRRDNSHNLDVLADLPPIIAGGEG